MSSKETALNNITKLVSRFDEQYSSYKNHMYNENGYAEAYREVIC